MINLVLLILCEAEFRSKSLNGRNLVNILDKVRLHP